MISPMANFLVSVPQCVSPQPKKRFFRPSLKKVFSDPQSGLSDLKSDLADLNLDLSEPQSGLPDPESGFPDLKLGLLES